MGTNFYWVQRDENGKVIPHCKPRPDGLQEDEYYHEVNYDEDDIQIHIGKRSMAGAYCYDCGTTLCRGGSRDVHHGLSEYERRQFAHLDGIERIVAEQNAAFFEECPSCGKPRGELKGVCSFSWTLMKHRRRLEELAGISNPSPEDSLSPSLATGGAVGVDPDKMKSHNEIHPTTRELFGDQDGPGVFADQDGNIGSEFVVVDDYYRYYTAAEFVAMTDEYKLWFQCPYRFS